MYIAKSRNSNSSLQIQMESKFQFEFVPRDTENSEFPTTKSLDLADFGGVAIAVEKVKCGKHTLSSGGGGLPLRRQMKEPCVFEEDEG